MISLGWSILWQGQIRSFRLLSGKKVEKCIFGCFCALRYNNAFKFNHYEILEVKFFWRLGLWSNVNCLSTLLKGLSSETTPPILLKFQMQLPRKGGGGIFLYFFHVTGPRWLLCPYIVKPLKTFFSRATWRIALKLCSIWVVILLKFI